MIITFTVFKTVCHTPNIDLVARIENYDDDSLICEVTLDNEPINVAYLTYKWYEYETEIPQETDKQLQQRQSVFMSKQKYKCVVVYKRGNISIEATSNTLTVKKKSKCAGDGANIIIKYTKLLDKAYHSLAIYGWKFWQ